MKICFDIHKQYGPGLFESVYEKILYYELGKNNLEFVCQQPISLIHDGVDMRMGFKADIIVEDVLFN